MPDEPKDYITQLAPDELSALTLAALEFFQEDRKLAATELRKQPAFAALGSRAVASLLQSLLVAGVLERSGGNRDSAYQLTPLGILVRDGKRASQDQAAGQA